MGCCTALIWCHLCLTSIAAFGIPTLYELPTISCSIFHYSLLQSRLDFLNDATKIIPTLPSYNDEPFSLDMLLFTINLQYIQRCYFANQVGQSPKWQYW